LGKDRGMFFARSRGQEWRGGGRGRRSGVAAERKKAL
jgi:hypothetical protein